jgi:beta-glucosidase/6-phospho-beta-glucosidase/beta-galactosidase
MIAIPWNAQNLSILFQIRSNINSLSEDGFPSDFVWGVATSAYQIEGATHEDGRGESIWDTFVQRPGTILDNSTGDRADDHYHLWKQDVALMKSLNVRAYRFSISWTRIYPTGRGEINPAGIRFYDTLINELLAHRIDPWITLFHWDLPQALQDDYGGWLDRRTVDAFAEYARTIYTYFGSKVTHFITLNEPWTLYVEMLIYIYIYSSATVQSIQLLQVVAHWFSSFYKTLHLKHKVP